MTATGDRGAVLIDLLVGLALTTLAATTVALLLTGAARTVEKRDDRSAPLVLATDQLTSDVRGADGASVVRAGPAGVWAVDLVGADGTVRWELRSDVLTRRESPGSPRVVLEALDPVPPFELLDARGTVIDPDDDDAVRRCTRLLGFDLRDGDGEWTRQRVVALRAAVEVEPC